LKCRVPLRNYTRFVKKCNMIILLKIVALLLIISYLISITSLYHKYIYRKDKIIIIKMTKKLSVNTVLQVGAYFLVEIQSLICFVRNKLD